MRKDDWASSWRRRTCSRLKTHEHMVVGTVRGSKGINIKTRGLLERNCSTMYIMYQDRCGLAKDTL